MATSSITSPVTRETPASVRDKGSRAVIATIRGGLLELRAKGLRSTECLDLASLYYQAVRHRIARERAERKASRKAPRKGKGATR